VVDALDLCYTKSHVNTFVIISGDSDFSPLVSKLRENAKQVIGVGVKQSTSDLLVANCDEFIFYDDLVRDKRRAASTRADTRDTAPAPKRTPEEERARREDVERRRLQGVEIAVETFEALVAERGDSGKIWASVLKEAIKRRNPGFSEGAYGFRTFGHLLEEAQTLRLLAFGRDDKSGAYVFRGAGMTAPVAPAAPLPRPADALAATSSADAADAAPAAHTGPDTPPDTDSAREHDAPPPRREGRSRGGRGRGGRSHSGGETGADTPSASALPAESPAARDAEPPAPASRDDAPPAAEPPRRTSYFDRAPAPPPAAPVAPAPAPVAAPEPAVAADATPPARPARAPRARPPRQVAGTDAPAGEANTPASPPAADEPPAPPAAKTRKPAVKAAAKPPARPRKKAAGNPPDTASGE
jgi:hypothetical protein